MRILMLTELYPPFIGGSEQHVRNLSRELVKRGYDVSVATIAPDNRPSVEEEDGVRVHRIASTTRRATSINVTGRPYLPPFPDPDVVRGLRRIVKSERPSVVHAHNWMVHSFQPLKRASGAKLVMTLHDYSVACAKRSLLYRERPCTGPGFTKCLRCASGHYGALRGPAITLGNWTSQPFLKRSVDRFLPVSNYVAVGNELAHRRMPFEVIPNFVPDNVADSAHESDAADVAVPSEPFWVYVGTLSRHKGVQVLLSSYASLTGAPPLVIVGRDSGEAPRRYPDRVTVLKDLPHPAVMAVWRKATLGIIPSLFPDPCPTVALEAMAAGVPLVASRTGGLPDLVADGVSGLLVEPGDVAGLTDALRRIIAEPALRDHMSHASLSRGRQFTAATVIPRIEAVYSRLMAV